MSETIRSAIISTHDLTRRSTYMDTIGKYSRDISTHDLAKRSTENTCYILIVSEDVSTHDLARRSTACSAIENIHLCHFNSRPHEEVDALLFPIVLLLSLFQLTTSRGGRQGYRFAHSTGENISTHDLTRRSTSTR